MNQSEQTQRFAEEIGRVITYFRKEYSLTLAAVIGVLEIHKGFLIAETYEDGADDSEHSPIDPEMN